MAKLYITEYALSTPQQVASGLPVEPALADQTPVTISSTASSSSTLNINTQLVRLQADTVCSVSVAVTPTATTNTHRMASGVTEYFLVPQSSSYKISVISNT